MLPSRKEPATTAPLSGLLVKGLYGSGLKLQAPEREGRKCSHRKSEVTNKEQVWGLFYSPVLTDNNDKLAMTSFGGYVFGNIYEKKNPNSIKFAVLDRKCSLTLM